MTFGYFDGQTGVMNRVGVVIAFVPNRIKIHSGVTGF
jgi:hypothetical protein